MENDIIAIIAKNLIEGGWSSIYQFVSNHLTNEDIKEFESDKFIDFVPNNSQYKNISDIEASEILNKNGLVITKYNSSIKECNILLSYFEEFCKENHYPTGTLYIVTSKDFSSLSNRYYTITDYGIPEIIEEFLKTNIIEKFFRYTLTGSL